MKHSTTHISDTKVKVTITVEPAELEEAKNSALIRLSKDVKAPGFRPGKTPAAMAEKFISPELLQQELLDRAINKAVVDVFSTDGMQPLDRPSVEVTKYEPGKTLEFSAETEILPKVVLGDYKKLTIKKAKIAVSDQELNDVLERMRLGFAMKNEVKRVAKDGDEVWIDFDGKTESGESVEGASGKDYPLNLGSGTFIPGFEEGLIGKKAGDKFDLPLSFPADYHAKQLAGTSIVFSIVVKQVKEVVLPELNDELAKKAGSFKNLDELKADIKKEIIQQKEREHSEQVKDSLVEQLISVSTVPVPETLVKDQTASIERDALQNLMSRGVQLDDYLKELGFNKDTWHEKELKPAAIRRVQAGLALAELSKAENIEVTKAELDKRHEQLLSQYPDPNIRAQLDAPEARRDLANRVLTEKTVDRLIELNSK